MFFPEGSEESPSIQCGEASEILHVQLTQFSEKKYKVGGGGAGEVKQPTCNRGS